MAEAIRDCGMSFEQWRELVILSASCIALLIVIVLIGGGLLISRMYKRKKDA